jgi:Cu-processing system permease protein
MIEPRTVHALARVELRASLRNWWLLLYALVFAVLAGGVAQISSGEFSGLERGAFGRTAAALTNIVLLVVPLFGLIAGAVSIAGDRERGVLAYYLAQPISVAEVFWGKYLGGAVALLTALAAGFAVAALSLAGSGALELTGFLWLVLLSMLLMLAAYSLGVLISTLAQRSALAVGVAVFVWVGVLFLGDLGLMATAIATQLDFRVVIGAALLNPAQAFKVATVQQVGASLDALGPAGNYLVDRFGGTLVPLLSALLVAWIVAPAAIALAKLRHSDAV